MEDNTQNEAKEEEEENMKQTIFSRKCKHTIWLSATWQHSEHCTKISFSFFHSAEGDTQQQHLNHSVDGLFCTKIEQMVQNAKYERTRMIGQMRESEKRAMQMLQSNNEVRTTSDWCRSMHAQNKIHNQEELFVSDTFTCVHRCQFKRNP